MKRALCEYLFEAWQINLNFAHHPLTSHMKKLFPTTSFPPGHFAGAMTNLFRFGINNMIKLVQPRNCFKTQREDRPTER